MELTSGLPANVRPPTAAPRAPSLQPPSSPAVVLSIRFSPGQRCDFPKVLLLKWHSQHPGLPQAPARPPCASVPASGEVPVLSVQKTDVSGCG